MKAVLVYLENQVSNKSQLGKSQSLQWKMEEFEMEAEGLLARCILHENDHLDGVIYVDKVEGRLYNNEELQDEE